jgi:hypothetical protein
MVPLGWILLGGVGVLAALYALYAVLSLVAPKVAAVMTATAKEGLSQPLFYVALGIGSFLLILFTFVPYNTFGEDIKMLKSSSQTLIMILSIVVALWTASVSIADEIEGRTALTLLSKPVGRRQFVIGKFLGVIAPVAVLFTLLSVLFLATVSYKVPYDARENSQQPPKAADCMVEVQQAVPGLFLAFLEVIMLTSISVAISTRLPMLPNLVICASVYVLGHLVPLIVQSSVGRFPIVLFFAQLIAVVLPNLESFNIEAAVFTGRAVPMDYLGWAMLYCGLYTLFALVAALFLFEDRDLA